MLHKLWGGALGILKGVGISLATYWLARVFLATITYIFYRKQIGKVGFFKLLYYIFMFPFFDYIGKWTSYVALFKKIEWKPIPHDYVVDVKKLK